MNSIEKHIDGIEIWQLQELMLKGKTDSLDPKIIKYIEWMEKARDLHYQNKTEKFVVRMLQATIKEDEKCELSEWRARKIFGDAMNFFYANSSIRKDSYRNIMYEKYMNAAAMAFDAREWELYRNFMHDAERMKRLNEADKASIDPRLLNRKPRFYYVKAADFGGIDVDRNELLVRINRYDISESERSRIKREAGIGERKLWAEDAEVVE